MKLNQESKIEKRLYFLAISPLGRVKDLIDEIKLDIYQKYGLKGAFRSPPHITLQMPFKKKPKQLEALVADLEALKNGFSPFEIQLDGFNCFPPRVIFIDVEENEYLNNLQMAVVELMKTHQVFHASYKGQAFRPHITMAFRDLKKKVFPLVWEDYKDIHFYESFKAEGISLYQHNGEKWELYKFFSFSQN